MSSLFAGNFAGQIITYSARAVTAAQDVANQTQLESIENAQRNVLRTVTVLRGISQSVPGDCLNLYRNISDYEPARLTVFLNEARAAACAVPLQQLGSQLATLANELYAVPGLERWGEVISSLTDQPERVSVELDVMREGATEKRKLPGWVWGLVGLFVLDRVSRFAR